MSKATSSQQQQQQLQQAQLQQQQQQQQLQAQIPQTTGTFPILASSVITECLQELGMELTEADLREPKPRTMALVFENFVDLLMGVSRDDSAPLTANATAMDVLEHPELHDTSLGEIKIVKAL
jgi:type II secretory pathway pseudopilin PulG